MQPPFWNNSFLHSAVRQAIRQVRDVGDPNIHGVGLGVGLKDGRIDLSRPLCMRFFVRRKHQARRTWTKQKFPVHPEIALSVGSLRTRGEVFDAMKRNIRRGRLEIPTDVYEARIVRAAGTARLDGDPDVVTSGTIVRWRVHGFDKTQWGVLTVGHAFESAPNAGIGDDVSIQLHDGDHFRGKRIVNFNPPSHGVDATLIRVRVDDLMDRGLIGDPGEASFPVVKFDDIKRDRFPIGISTQTDRDVSFDLVTVVSSLDIARIGKVTNMIHVQGAAESFVEGTSGSLFRCIDTLSGTLTPIALQVGAHSSGFSDGYGQSLDTALSEIRTQLNGMYAPGYVIGEIEVVQSF